MTDDAGKNESRTLQGGEIVYLVKEPGEKWKIRFYECRHNVRLAGSDGMVFEYLEGLPQDWKNRKFDSADDAAEFVQEEIRQGKVPKNSEPRIEGGDIQMHQNGSRKKRRNSFKNFEGVSNKNKNTPIVNEEPSLESKLHNIAEKWKDYDDDLFHSRLAILVRDITIYLSEHDCKEGALFEEVVADATGKIYLDNPNSLFFELEKAKKKEYTLPEHIVEYALNEDVETSLELLESFKPHQVPEDLVKAGKALLAAFNEKLKPYICKFGDIGIAGLGPFVKDVLVAAFGAATLFANCTAAVCVSVLKIGLKKFCKDTPGK